MTTTKPAAQAGSSNPVPARRPKRRPPALASKILATGISTAAALHLVTTMELKDKTAGASAAPPQPVPAAQAAAPAAVQPRPRPTVYVVVRRLVETPAETAGSISPQGAAPVPAARAGRTQPAGANNPAAAQSVRVAPRPQATTRAS